jgi:hypothetical protein
MTINVAQVTTTSRRREAPNKALQLTATRYAGCPQLSLVVIEYYIGIRNR